MTFEFHASNENWPGLILGFELDNCQTPRKLNGIESASFVLFDKNHSYLAIDTISFAQSNELWTVWLFLTDPQKNSLF